MEKRESSGIRKEEREKEREGLAGILLDSNSFLQLWCPWPWAWLERQEYVSTSLNISQRGDKTNFTLAFWSMHANSTYQWIQHLKGSESKFLIHWPVLIPETEQFVRLFWVTQKFRFVFQYLKKKSIWEIVNHELVFEKCKNIWTVRYPRSALSRRLTMCCALVLTCTVNLFSLCSWPSHFGHSWMPWNLFCLHQRREKKSEEGGSLWEELTD